MKILKSFWTVSFLALIIGLVGVWFAVFQYQNYLASVLIPPVPEIVEESEIYWSFRTGEIDNLVESLNSEKAAMNARKAEILEMEARLKSEADEIKRLQADLEERRAQLESYQAELNEQILELKDSEVKNLKTLANTYANLTPDSIIEIFKEMDDTTVVKILSLMKAEMVAGIFEKMIATKSDEKINAKRVAEISERLRMQLSAKNKTKKK